MKRRELIPMLVGTAALSQANAGAKPPKKEASDGANRWGFLGDDDSLRKTIREAGQVLLICVYQISLDQVKPPFAQVFFRATVVQTVKGIHRMGDRISIRFMTDSLPGDETERAKFNEDATAKNLGSLKMAFLQGAKADEYGCEWLEVPSFDPDMLNFATKNSR